MIIHNRSMPMSPMMLVSFVWPLVLLALLIRNTQEQSTGKLSICFTQNGATEKYYPDRQICCNGYVGPRQPKQECCDGVLYFTSDKICCNGSLEPRFVPPFRKNEMGGIEQQCCGGNKLFNVTDHLCCFGNTIPLTPEQVEERDGLECCSNSAVFNQASELCCGGKIAVRRPGLDCCGKASYDKGIEHCRFDGDTMRVLFIGEQLCGNVVYKMRDKSCCGDVLNHTVPEIDSRSGDYDPRVHCCDNLFMDTTKEKCCRNHYSGFPTHTIPKNKSLKCCGNGFYNKDSQECIGGQPVDKKPGHELCGGEFITGDKTCCGDKHSGISYHLKTHTCCQGSHLSVIPKETHTCCNGKGVDTKTQICCDGILPVNKTRENDDECCFNYYALTGQSYNRHNKRCKDGQIWDVSPDHEACGTPPQFDPRKEVCCGGRVFPLNSSITGCCGDVGEEKPYNNRTQLCCNIKLHDMSPDNGSCCNEDDEAYKLDDPNNPCLRMCGEQTYDNAKETCCAAEIYPSRGAHYYCCGNAYINEYRFDCCDGVPFRPESNGITRQCSKGVVSESHLCGDSQQYNPSQKVCCSGQVYDRSSGVTGCCGDVGEEKPYNNRTQLCCNIKMHDMSPEEGSCCYENDEAYKFNHTTNPCLRTCGESGLTYDNARQTCCSGKVYQSKGSRYTCCGPFYINERRYDCCASRFPFRRGGTGGTRCCQNVETYNIKLTRCRKRKDKRTRLLSKDSNLRKQKDPQKLCHNSALRFFDGAIQSACSSKYAIQGNVRTVKIRRRSKFQKIILVLDQVSNLNRGIGFHELQLQTTFVIKIRVHKNENVKCRKRYLQRKSPGNNMIMAFFSEEPVGRIVKIQPHSKIFMTSHSEKRELKATLSLSNEFCKENYENDHI